MPHDPNAYADLVVLTIKATLAPVLERLALSEQTQRELQGKVQELTGLLERVVAVETKAAMLMQDVSAVDMRDRVVALETKTATKSEPDTSVGTRLFDLEQGGISLREKVSELTIRLAAVSELAKDVGALRERASALETKAALPAPVAAVKLVDEPDPRVGELREKVSELTFRLEAMSELAKDVGALRERAAVLETRAPVPGPAGQNGTAGHNGRDGKDGADGLGFEDLDVEFDGDRTVSLKFARDGRTKTWPIVLPFMKQKGVWREGTQYVAGDVVTWGGSQWHCNEPTSMKPGEGTKAWTLIVKRGQDGKDGRDAVTMPVVTVGRST